MKCFSACPPIFTVYTHLCGSKIFPRSREHHEFASFDDLPQPPPLPPPKNKPPLTDDAIGGVISLPHWTDPDQVLSKGGCAINVRRTPNARMSYNENTPVIMARV